MIAMRFGHRSWHRAALIPDLSPLKVPQHLPPHQETL
jgi:hypothetical protein